MYGFYFFQTTDLLFIFANGEGKGVTKLVIHCGRHKCMTTYLNMNIITPRNIIPTSFDLKCYLRGPYDDYLRPCHCKYSLLEKCPYSELFWSAFSRIRTEYREIRSISPYSVRMLENCGPE